MQNTSKRDEPAKRPQPTPPGRGTPSTNAAQSLRKNLTLRVAVVDPKADGDELKEDGYGHGV